MTKKNGRALDDIVHQRQENLAFASAVPVVMGCVALVVAQAVFGGPEHKACTCTAEPAQNATSLADVVTEERAARCEASISDLWVAAGSQVESIAWRRLTLCQQAASDPPPTGDNPRATKHMHAVTIANDACKRDYHADMRRQRETFDRLMWQRFIAMQDCATYYVAAHPGRATTMFSQEDI